MWTVATENYIYIEKKSSSYDRPLPAPKKLLKVVLINQIKNKKIQCDLKHVLTLCCRIKRLLEKKKK